MKGEAIFFEYNYIAVVSMNFMNSGNDVLYYIPVSYTHLRAHET